MRLAVLAIALVACQSADVSRSVGARCDTNADCDVKCMGPSGDWPGGFCTTLCSDDHACPENARCIEEDGGVCAFACTIDTDCAFLGPDYHCTLQDDHGGGLKVMVCRGG